MFLGIDWVRFIEPSFWFETNPGGLSSRFEIIFLVVLAVSYGLYVIALIFRNRLSKAKNTLYAGFWGKMARLFLTLAVSFTFIFFFRYEGVPYLGGRYWFLIWGVGGFIWLLCLIYYYYRTLPQKVRERELKREKNKYLKRYK